MHRDIVRVLQTLDDVGLGLHPAGPELAHAVGRRGAAHQAVAASWRKVATGRTLYILDEPTTGLHFDDIRKLLLVLSRLVEAGNTVVVIEHNLDVIKSADWVIDLGPEGGAAGGQVLATGTPEEVAQAEASHTGRYLRHVLKKGRKARIGRRVEEPVTYLHS